MTELFLNILNMSISASWLVLAVLLLRLLFKRAPKWATVCLWGIVALRLLCFCSIESPWSLIPSAETIPPAMLLDPAPAIESGVPAIDGAVNPILGESSAPAPGASANPLQITFALYALLWLIGLCAMLLYAAISYLGLRRRIGTAVLREGNIYESERVQAPFVLGIVRPRIYLPMGMGEGTLRHVVAHERAHICRRDHLWKPLGFLLLSIHWFNPLLWLAYALLSRDIELACDERVIRELGHGARADYSEALLACSMGERRIVACPLAFGETGVKERVKAVLRYKKPALWAAALAGIACAAVAACFLTNPLIPRTFAMESRSIASLEPAEIVAEIRALEGLPKNAPLYTNSTTFDLHLSADFEWWDAEAMRFFFVEDGQTYSGQLRLFFEDGEYFITERSEWLEHERRHDFETYLEALRYLPQEEIRALSPDADQYIVSLIDHDPPEESERVLAYASPMRNIHNASLQLMIHPLHATGDGSYSGSGEEILYAAYLYYAEEGEPKLTCTVLSDGREEVIEAVYWSEREQTWSGAGEVPIGLIVDQGTLVFTASWASDTLLVSEHHYIREGGSTTIEKTTHVLPKTTDGTFVLSVSRRGEGSNVVYYIGAPHGRYTMGIDFGDSVDLTENT